MLRVPPVQGRVVFAFGQPREACFPCVSQQVMHTTSMSSAAVIDTSRSARLIGDGEMIGLDSHLFRLTPRLNR